MEPQGTPNSQNNLEKEDKTGGLISPNFQMYIYVDNTHTYSIVIKTM